MASKAASNQSCIRLKQRSKIAKLVRFCPDVIMPKMTPFSSVGSYNHPTTRKPVIC